MKQYRDEVRALVFNNFVKEHPDTFKTICEILPGLSRNKMVRLVLLIRGLLDAAEDFKKTEKLKHTIGLLGDLADTAPHKTF